MTGPFRAFFFPSFPSLPHPSQRVTCPALSCIGSRSGRLSSFGDPSDYPGHHAGFSWCGGDFPGSHSPPREGVFLGTSPLFVNLLRPVLGLSLALSLTPEVLGTGSCCTYSDSPSSLSPPPVPWPFGNPKHPLRFSLGRLLSYPGFGRYQLRSTPQGKRVPAVVLFFIPMAGSTPPFFFGYTPLAPPFPQLAPPSSHDPPVISFPFFGRFTRALLLFVPRWRDTWLWP